MRGFTESVERATKSSPALPVDSGTAKISDPSITQIFCRQLASMRLYHSQIIITGRYAPYKEAVKKRTLGVQDFCSATVPLESNISNHTVSQNNTAIAGIATIKWPRWLRGPWHRTDS